MVTYSKLLDFTIIQLYYIVISSKVQNIIKLFQAISIIIEIVFIYDYITFVKSIIYRRPISILYIIIVDIKLMNH